MYTATVTSKGQTTIPAELRERLGIEPGTKLVFTVLPDGRVIMQAQTGTVADLAGLLRREGQRPVSIEEMDQGIAEAVALRDARSRN